MTNNRILDISESPVRLSVRYDQLVIENEKKHKSTAPLADIAALVVSNPQVSYTQAVLTGLARNGAVLVACDEKRMPAVMALPLLGNYVQAERFALQAEAAAPLKKRAWQQIVNAKICAQARTLKELYGNDRGISELARKVKSGDTANMEARASKRYWPALFDDTSFRRDRQREDQNKNLNYGYAVLRAIIARAICAAGLHPSLGVHHHNRYDAFCLADDLMEPYRPLVDKAVARWVKDNDPQAKLDKHAKQALLEPLTGKYSMDGEERTLFDAAAKMAGSLVKMFEGKTKQMVIPEV